MSHATAKTHVSRLLTKLDARDRAQLVMLAYESGVVTPGGEPTVFPDGFFDRADDDRRRRVLRVSRAT